MTTAAYIFIVLSGITIVFQACLAGGVPWGSASMGGKFPGKYPPKMRVVAVINMLLISFLALVVLSKAELLFPQMKTFSDRAIWGVVIFSVLGTLLNTITPSKIECIWAPVLFIQLICSIIIATS